MPEKLDYDRLDEVIGAALCVVTFVAITFWLVPSLIESIQAIGPLPLR